MNYRELESNSNISNRNPMNLTGIYSHFTMDQYEILEKIVDQQEKFVLTPENIDLIEEKPWREPGVDITDYFNYGFNENTWKQQK
jgi:hypothetical protein